MSNSTQKLRKSPREVATALGLTLFVVCSFAWCWNKYLFVQDTKEAMKKTLHQHVALEAFSGVGLIAKNGVTEIDCTGSNELVVTCKTNGNELQTFRFKSMSPLPDFRVHAFRQVVDPSISMEIRIATGIPKSQDDVEMKELEEVFRNPING